MCDYFNLVLKGSSVMQFIKDTYTYLTLTVTHNLPLLKILGSAAVTF